MSESASQPPVFVGSWQYWAFWSADPIIGDPGREVEVAVSGLPLLPVQWNELPHPRE